MSRGSRRQKRRKYVLGFIPQDAMPLVLGALGLIAIAGAALIWLKNRPDPDYQPEVAGEPAIEVSNPEVDLGDVKLNEMVEVTYVVRNVGDEPLRIAEVPTVEVLEGC